MERVRPAPASGWPGGVVAVLALALAGCPIPSIPVFDAEAPDTGGAAPADAELEDAGAAEDAVAHEDARAEDARTDGGVVVAPDLGVVPDSGVVVPDTGVVPDSGVVPDAGGCVAPAAMVDGPFSPNPAPPTAHLLVTDTASQAVFRLSLTGQVLESWTDLPVLDPFGVAHDRRTTSGFFVSGAMRSINRGGLYRVAITGAVTATIAQGDPSGRNWGMMHLLGSTPARDVLAHETVGIGGPVLMGLFGNGVRAFEGSMPSGQWYGFHAERYACDDAATLVYWTTRDGNVVELRDWTTTAPLRRFVIVSSTDIRGITRTPRGDFYLVDRQNARLLHLTRNFVLIDSIPTPGSQPADVSYAE